MSTPYTATADDILRRVQSALTRARSRSYKARTWQMGRNHWRVASQTERGKSYDVTVWYAGYCYGVHPARLACNCQSTGPCKHAAKVALRLQRESAGGRKRAPRVTVKYTARPRVVESKGGELFEEATATVTLESLFS